MINYHTCTYNNNNSRRQISSVKYVDIIFRHLIISIIFTFPIMLIFPQNVDCTDLVSNKYPKKKKDSVQKSKEISDNFPISNYIPIEKQAILWISPHFENSKSIPEPDDFILVSQEPMVDLNELQQNIVYPAKARKDKIQGKVVLRILVNTNGDILKIICEYTDSKLLNQAALDAVLKTKFAPAIQDKKKVIYWVSVPINFKLK